MPVGKLVSGAKTTGQMIWQTANEFVADGCMQMAAALSYYTIFSLPPLLILLIMMIEPLLDPETVTQMVQQQIGGLLGPEGAEQVRTMIEHVSRPGAGGPIPAALSIGAFLFGATVAFAQLQFALNTAWGVGPDPTRGDIKNFVFKRVLSFAMILAIGFMLLVSMVLSALLAAFGDILAAMAPAAVSTALLHFINNLVAFTVITLLFTAMFKLLPDAVVAWRDALVGGVVTALLFNLGRLAIGFYLGQADPGSVYGAAGSLAVVLVWIYYSSLILLVGAEFTQVFAKWRGFPIVPERGAVRVIHTQERWEVEEEERKAAEQAQ